MADKDSREGKRYQTPEIIKYVNETHASHDAALAGAFAVPEGIPAIQVGPSEGRLLYLLLRMINAKKVVEVGTLVGYSAIQMARALPADGHLYSIEFDPKHADVARKNIERAGLADRITVIVGAGVDVLPTLEQHGPFDAVFIDADKQNYDRYGQWATQHLRKGGLVLGDNAYLFGELLDATDRGRGMRDFHEHVAKQCESVCLPTPDGLVLGIKR
jgi:caffeoyl-CoA O-methyltransferase